MSDETTGHAPDSQDDDDHTAADHSTDGHSTDKQATDDRAPDTRTPSEGGSGFASVETSQGGADAAPGTPDGVPRDNHDDSGEAKDQDEAQEDLRA